MKQIKFPLNQLKTITTRKILKLRKIKKRATNCVHGIKRVKNKTKKNDSKSGKNSIQQIKQRLISLMDKINKYVNRTNEPATSENNTNIDNQTNYITLCDNSTVQKKPFSPSIAPFLIFSDANFYNMYDISFSDPEQDNNLSELIIENQANDRNNIPLFDMNNSNTNEFSPQNTNANNNNLNMIHFDYDFARHRDLLSIPTYRGRRRRINSTQIREIKKKLTKIRFKKSIASNGNSEKCSICFEDFQNNQKVYSLPCHHLFHIRCLGKEINYRQKCPICRKEL